MVGIFKNAFLRMYLFNNFFNRVIGIIKFSYKDRFKVSYMWDIEGL